MKMDEQIIVPECEGCGMKWSKYAPLVYFYSKRYCGNCFVKVRDAYQKIMLEEVEKRAFQKS